MLIEEALNQLTLSKQFIKLFESTRGILFFIKDRDCKLITGNKALLKHLNLTSAKEALNKSDFDLFPVEIAQRYYEDDLEVMNSGQEKTDIVELFPNHKGELQWFLTTKIPVFDAKGDVAGLCGILQSYKSSSHDLEILNDISPALDYMKTHYKEKISNTELASLCSLSVRQFDHRFKNIFKVTTHQYLLRMKILKACQLIIETDIAIADIANLLNFYDQSAFANQFKKQVGQTPLQYLKTHKS